MKCEACGRVIGQSDGCTWGHILCDGKVYKRNRYWESDECPDCGAKFGQFHHLGCDMEICPICGMQLLGCDCDLEFALLEPKYK